MQIGAGPPPHAMRPPDRSVAAPVEAEVAATKTVVAPGESPGPKADGVRPGGSDTPWQHALHRGNGEKAGIHRRFAAEIAAASQAALGLTPPPAEGPGDAAAVNPPLDVPSVDELPAAETPSGEVPIGSDAPPAAGPTEPSGDVGPVVEPLPPVIIDGTVDNGLLEMIESLQSDLPEPIAAPVQLEE